MKNATKFIGLILLGLGTLSMMAMEREAEVQGLKKELDAINKMNINEINKLAPEELHQIITSINLYRKTSGQRVSYLRLQTLVEAEMSVKIPQTPAPTRQEKKIPTEPTPPAPQVPSIDEALQALIKGMQGQVAIQDGFLPTLTTPPIGLSNPDARCFMSAALQCFYNLRGCTDLILRQNSVNFFTDQRALRYAALCQKLEEKKNEPKPTPINTKTEEYCRREDYKFGQETVADSGEFLGQLLVSLTNNPVNEPLKKRIFLNTLDANSRRPESLMITPLRLKKDDQPELINLFSHYFLDDNLPIRETGPYLILEINRLDFDVTKKTPVRIDKPSPFPLENFSIESFCEQNAPGPKIYRLNSVTFHDGGHYFAFVRRGEQWYKADDSVVEAIPLARMQEIAQKGEYKKGVVPTLLFYEAQV